MHAKVKFHLNISTHALTEGDCFLLSGSQMEPIFQLTPSRRATEVYVHTPITILFQLTPSRRATLRFRNLCCKRMISTHALTEGDVSAPSISAVSPYFNSRPHGGRPLHVGYISITINFNSRPHGGRRNYPVRNALQGYFNSRPHGGRQVSNGG